MNARSLFLLAMMLLGIGIGTSNILMSWGQILLGIAFLWDGHFKSKSSTIKNHRPVLSFVGVYLLFLIGLIHTSNFTYAFYDLKTKLPLLVIPLLTFGFSPITKKEFRIIFHSIFAGVLFTILFGAFIYWGLVEWKVKDMRSYSPFISNVRFGTLLVISMVLSVYIFSKKELRFINRWFYLLMVPVYMGFILLIQSLTGMVALVTVSLAIAVYGLFQPALRKKSVLFLIIAFVITSGLGYMVWREYKRVNEIDKVDYASLPLTTPDGNPYYHDITDQRTMNGHHVYLYQCQPEMETEWNKRSQYAFNGPSKFGWNMNGMVMLYLTSKGWPKNGESIRKLSNREIKAIENGTINYLSLHPLDIRGRMNQLFVELNTYRKTGDPNNQSFSTRLETWSVALFAIKHQIINGYGTGDVKDVMKKTYRETGSKLEEKNQMNPHQQFLSVTLAIGIFGALMFVILLYAPLFRIHRIHILFMTVLVIGLVSMLDEDTLETQAGCTQFVFMYMLTWLYHRAFVQEREIIY